MQDNGGPDGHSTRVLLLHGAQKFCSALATALRKGPKAVQFGDNVRSVTISLTMKSAAFEESFQTTSQNFCN
jgi:hypothetical protein